MFNMCNLFLFCACWLLLSQLGPQPVTAQVATATANGKPPSAGECPLTSEDFAQTNYASVRKACDIDSMTDATFCNSCVCGLGTAIVLSFDKAGTKVNGQPVSALAASGDIATLSNLLSNCSAVMGIELLQAGALTAQALGQLSTCDVNQSSLDCASAAAPGTAPGVMSTTNGSAGPATAAPGSVSALERGQQQHTAKSAVSAAAAHAPAMPMVALATAVLLAAVVLM